MATESEIEDFQKEIAAFLKYEKSSLLSNAEWGILNFSDCEAAYDNCVNILANFSTLPVEILPAGILPKITQQIASLQSTVNGINEFTLSQQSPSNVRDRLSQELKAQADQLYNVSYMHIPYLAYQRGDVERNIRQMISSVKKAEKETTDALSGISKQRAEIDLIVKSAREAAISAGVGHFTYSFLEESNEHARSSKFWLYALLVFAGITISCSLLFAYHAVFCEYNIERNIPIFTSKITVILLLLTGGVWCGKIYKSHKHLSFVNKHRANALKTFLAFSQASEDEQTKNAVLIEAAHCIFSASTTGFVDGNDPSEQIKFLEIFKSIKQP